MNLEKRTIITEVSEREYRKLTQRISSSDIRTFLQSRKKFYKTVILQERAPNDDTVSTILGSIADCILTCPDMMDDKFQISTSGIPAGQMGELCETLFKRAMKSIDADGVQKDQFETIFTDAVNSVKYDGNLVEVKFKGKSLEKILQMFTEPDKDGVIPELYYKEKLASIGKTVVSVNMMQSGEKHANDLKESRYTADIINVQTSGNVEVFYQLVVLFTYKDVQMRGMLDKTIVDHDKKTIQPIDIKTTYDNEGFDRSYLKGLYIQAAVYDAALNKWAKEHDLMGYEILPIKYPVADTANENMPLTYQLTTEDIKKAYTGFKLKGSNRFYKGLDQCIEEIKWHSETGEWRISREAYKNDGKLFMEFEYQN